MSRAQTKRATLIPVQRVELNDILCDNEEPGKHVKTDYYFGYLLNTKQCTNYQSRLWFLFRTSYSTQCRTTTSASRTSCEAAQD
jgi:hypothetical protein